MYTLLQAASDAPLGGAGVGWEALRMLLALGGVCALAWVGLHFIARRGVGRFGAGDVMRVVATQALDTRRRIMIVEVDGRRLLIGFGDTGPPRLLTELCLVSEKRDGSDELGVTEEERFGEDIPPVDEDEE